MPGDRERNRRIEQDIEVVGVVSAFVEVVRVKHNVLAYRLLKADVELIARARPQRSHPAFDGRARIARERQRAGDAILEVRRECRS